MPRDFSPHNSIPRKGRAAFFWAWLVLALPLASGRRALAAPPPVFTGPWIDLFGDLGPTMTPALADIDGDGDLDLFTWPARGAHQFLFFRNTGSAQAPAFGPPELSPFGIVGSPNYGFAGFGDIDGDGDLDLFVGGYAFTQFFENTGTATDPAFAPPVENAFGLGSQIYFNQPALVDIDGDGDLDTILGQQYYPVAFLPNTGTAASPAFAGPVYGAFGLPGWGSLSLFFYFGPTVTDLDGDGDFDFSGGFHARSFIQNTGTPTSPAFAHEAPGPFGLPVFGDENVLGDIDGDGDLDAFTFNNGHMFLIPNTGSATSGAFVPANPYALSDSAVTFADIDGDGDLDAFGLRYFFNNVGVASHPEFVRSTNLGLPFGYKALGDLDLDGDLDAVVGNQISINDGTPTSPHFAAPALAFPSPDYVRAALGDIDGDGDLDVFFGEKSGDLVFARNTGSAASPAFAAGSANPFGLTPVAASARPTLVDLDRDGDLDLFVGQEDGSTLFFENTGTSSAPAFAAAAVDPFGLDGREIGGHANPGFADLDDDGDLDAFIAATPGSSSEEQVFLFRNSAGGRIFADGFESGGTSAWSATH